MPTRELLTCPLLVLALTHAACARDVASPERFVDRSSGIVLVRVAADPDPFYLGETEVTVSQFRREVRSRRTVAGGLRNET